MLKLIIEDDEGRKTVVPFVREEITIGRQEGNTIRLTERNISRRHARLLRGDGAVLVEDLGSYNGIRLNGEKVRGQVQVQDGDLIQIGDYDLAIQNEPNPPDEEQPEADNEPTNPSPPPRLNGAHARRESEGEDDDTQKTSPGGPHESGRVASTSIIRADDVEEARRSRVVDIDPEEAPRLVVMNSKFGGREFACIRSELTLGRGSENDISLDHRSLSRTHVRITRDAAGEWRIVDLNSSNGLLVNGETYAHAALSYGDVIQLGHLKLRFLAPGATYKHVPEDEGGKRSRAATAVIVVLLLAAGVASGVWYYDQRRIQDAEATARGTGRSDGPAETASAPGDTSVGSETSGTVEQKLKAARRAIEGRDWDLAVRILNACTMSDGTLHAEARTLLAEMKAEAELKTNIDRAEKALAAGNLEEASGLLQQAAHTRLLVKPLEQLRAKARSATEARLAQGTGGSTGTPTTNGASARRTPDDRSGSGTTPKATGPAEAQRLYEEAVVLMRNKQVKEARTVLERCLKADGDYASCHKLLGSANARLSDPDKGAFHYRRFLDLAPDDKDAPKIRAFVEAYEASRP